MKRCFLLSVMYVLLASASCQKGDKNIIYGRWSVYSFSASLFSVNTDNLQQSQEAMLKTAILQSPTGKLSGEDSMKIIQDVLSLSKKIDSSYVEFEENGKYVSMIYFLEGEKKPQRKEGTFTRDGSKIQLHHDGIEETISVETLTSKNLVISGGAKDSPESYQLKFKRE